MKKVVLIIGLCILWIHTRVQASYRVRGQVNLSSAWQPQIFMAAIPSLDDYYNAYPDLLIDAAIIEPDGSFELSGDNLPLEPHFYRLYMMKKENSEFDACLYVGGDDHNFLHVILSEHSDIAISVDTQAVAPFAGAQISGDRDNERMTELSHLVLPKFYFYQIKYTSELRFSREKLNRDLLNFADTCQQDMASLAALINTDFDKYYMPNQEIYADFEYRLQRSGLNSAYLQDYQKKLLYHDPKLFRDQSRWKNMVIGVLSVIIIILLYFLLGKKQLKAIASPKLDDPRELLTNKEEEIFDLIVNGKSNKEIASQLFIEVSTVKTHINNIYSKLNVSSRREAQNLIK